MREKAKLGKGQNSAARCSRWLRETKMNGILCKVRWGKKKVQSAKKN